MTLTSSLVCKATQSIIFQDLNYFEAAKLVDTDY